MKKLLVIALTVALLGLMEPIYAAAQESLDKVDAPQTPSIADGKLIVHEWGTFTTFSGSDGVFLDFRPLAAQHNDLPNYVLDCGSYSKNVLRVITKSRLWGRVRMETPVTYFYTDRVRTVDVRVEFPQGLLTEFYPPVSSFEPAIQEDKIFEKGEEVGDSNLTWNRINLIPPSILAQNVNDANLREELIKSISNALLPHAANEQHYAAARQTDSALVHMPGGSQSHFEKFLFYRGVGKFDLPIRASFTGEQIKLENTGAHSLRSIVAFRVQDKQIEIARIDQLDANQTSMVSKFSPASVEQLSDIVRQGLVAEGLYAKEADAMVATWQSSWFTENGTRLLYMVPSAVTETLLPLNVTPKPQETVRVLVGRLEIMSPQTEQAMIQSVAQSAQARTQFYAAPKKKGAAPYGIPNAIRNFGRMAEPALIRISKIAKDPGVRQEAELLIAQYQQHD